MIRKSLLIWLSIIPLAILNGGLRDYVITPLIGESISLPLSGIMLCIMIFIVCLIFIPLLPGRKQNVYIRIGLLWVALTVCFEFGLGYFGMNQSLSELIRAYDVSTGNLWLLVVIFIGIAPWLTGKIKHLFIL